MQEVLEEQSNVKGRGQQDVDSRPWSQRWERLAVRLWHGVCVQG